MNSKWRSFLFVPSVMVLCALLGGLLAPGLNDVASAASEEDVTATIRNFTEVYDLVERNFADKLDADRAVYRGAIPGMLRTLDPHSSFFDPRDFQLLREDQKGHYYGVGMTVGPRNNRPGTIVIAPFPASPAYKAGIRPGDVIVQVNDTPTDNLSTTEVADLLKGPKGTSVQVMIAREGHSAPLPFTIVRDEIPRKSVPDAFWLKPGVAYLKIDQFNENTSTEMEDNLKRLGEKNVQGLVLDLRANPGGLLLEGVAVADHFLQPGQVIVKHAGRASPEKAYKARTGNGGNQYPIVVLVNSYSASAAEIVSGALQDHDRAWIFGETTFGKGLVQTVFPLAENTGLALTTARYYTPSGRLIQRDYANTSFFDYYYRKDADTKNMDDVKMTDSGRTVYGGGGITPDEKYETPKMNRFQLTLNPSRTHVFLGFTAHYLSTHDRKQITKEWVPTDAILDEFGEYLKTENIDYTASDFAENKDWIRQQLRQEFFIAVFNIDDSQKMMIQNDPEVLRAIDSLPKAKQLLDNAKKMIVQRMGGTTANQGN